MSVVRTSITAAFLVFASFADAQPTPNIQKVSDLCEFAFSRHSDLPFGYRHPAIEPHADSIQYPVNAQRRNFWISYNGDRFSAEFSQKEMPFFSDAWPMMIKGVPMLDSLSLGHGGPAQGRVFAACFGSLEEGNVYLEPAAVDALAVASVPEIGVFETRKALPSDEIVSWPQFQEHLNRRRRR